MSKIYGYKEREIKNFVGEIKKNKGPLSKLFERWAMITGKAKGSVRNMYYAIAEKSRTDENFCKTFFDGKPIISKSALPFSDCDTDTLIRQVENGKRSGKSVRSIVLDMANGDAKKALRLQNKYRSICKKSISNDVEFAKNIIGDSKLTEISCGIEALINKIANDVKEENKILKQKVRRLAIENFMLKNGENNKGRTALDYLLGDDNLPC